MKGEGLSIRRWLAGAVAVAAFVLPLQLQAQSGLAAALGLNEQGEIQLTWPVESLAPHPAIPVFTDYRVFASADLVHWAPFGALIRAEEFAGGTATVTIPKSANGQFFKVQSVLDFSHASFPTFFLRNARVRHQAVAGGSWSPQQATHRQCRLWSAFWLSSF